MQIIEGQSRNPLNFIGYKSDPSVSITVGRTETQKKRCTAEALQGSG